MSRSKKDRLFPKRIADAELAKSVADFLRQDYGDSSSAVKEIGRRTGANLRAVRNWFEARNAPSSAYLLVLARSSPGILKLVLEQLGGSDLLEAFHLLNGYGISRPVQAKNVPINVPIKSWSNDLNERQRWFLSELGRNQKPSAQDISRRWKVVDKTARRDIADMKARNLIGRVGAKKRGQYILVG